MAAEMRGLSDGSRSVELAPRSDGARYRRLSLQAGADGSLVLLSHDLGNGEGAEWGLDDEEITVTLQPEAVARLALALVAERLQGRTNPAATLVELCDEHDVA